MVKHLKFPALSLTNLLQNNNKVDSLLSKFCTADYPCSHLAYVCTGSPGGGALGG